MNFRVLLDKILLTEIILFRLMVGLFFIAALCRKMFEDDPDATAEDIESELAVIL